MRTLSSKILDKSTLIEKLRAAQRKKQKVVFTNGCFDLLHRGHVSYLEAARKKGALLVVGLNSDSSVRKLKGPTRPIVQLSDRMRVIAALESVDYVTSFNELTPLNLIKKLKPDVLVKGGDWKTSEIVGAKEVLSWGGHVFSLAFTEGRSTSRMVRQINGT